MSITQVIVLLILSNAPVSAQSGASITGSVKDPQGRAIEGATLTLFSSTGAAGGATTSGASGLYRFEGLPAGEYLLRASAPGFSLFLAGDLRLGAGTTESREVVLQIAGVHEQVVVTASSTPQLPEHVSKATTIIDQADADARDAAALSDVVALAPGLRVQQLGGPGAFTTIQIRGLRDRGHRDSGGRTALARCLRYASRRFRVNRRPTLDGYQSCGSDARFGIFALRHQRDRWGD